MSESLPNKEIIAKIMSNPLNYHIAVDNDEVVVYNKSNGDTHNLSGEPDTVLVEVFEYLGADAEHM